MSLGGFERQRTWTSMQELEEIDPEQVGGKKGKSKRLNASEIRDLIQNSHPD